jgi:nitrite reductase (NADH) small subunit
MAFVKVGTLSALAPGQMAEYRSGERQIALCNVGGTVHAIDNFCPHRGGPLAQGALHGSTVVCPWHAWEFDCETGVCDFNADLRVRKYDVRIVGDEIHVEL